MSTTLKDKERALIFGEWFTIKEKILGDGLAWHFEREKEYSQCNLA